MADINKTRLQVANILLNAESMCKSGGTAGQVLTKASGSDFDVKWVTPSAGGGTGGTPEAHASTHAADGSDPITPESIGAAPGGYGLGGGATKIDNLNDAVNNGWYLIAGTVSNGPKESIYGWMLVSSRSGSGGMIRQDFWEAITNPIHYVRYAVNGEFKEWEYVNPPMASGIEYRTTERYKEKAVYKKLDTDGVNKWRLDGEDTWHTDKLISKSVTLSASAWNSTAKTQTVTVSGVLADETKQLITPTPALASQDAYYNAGIRCTGQSADKLTFTAKTIPTADLKVYVTIQEVGA